MASFGFVTKNSAYLSCQRLERCRQVDVILRSKVHPERFFVGGAGGLRSFWYENDRWRDEGQIAGVDVEVRSIVETEKGVLWLGTLNSGVVHVSFEKGRLAIAGRLECDGMAQARDFLQIMDGSAFIGTMGASFSRRIGGSIALTVWDSDFSLNESLESVSLTALPLSQDLHRTGKIWSGCWP